MTTRPDRAEPALRPFTMQRLRAKTLLASLGIGPGYRLTYTEALNAMTLFATNEKREAVLASSQRAEKGKL